MSELYVLQGARWSRWSGRRLSLTRHFRMSAYLWEASKPVPPGLGPILRARRGRASDPSSAPPCPLRPRLHTAISVLLSCLLDSIYPRKLFWLLPAAEWNDLAGAQLVVTLWSGSLRLAGLRHGQGGKPEGTRRLGTAEASGACCSIPRRANSESTSSSTASTLSIPAHHQVRPLPHGCHHAHPPHNR